MWRPLLPTSTEGIATRTKSGRALRRAGWRTGFANSAGSLDAFCKKCVMQWPTWGRSHAAVRMHGAPVSNHFGNRNLQAVFPGVPRLDSNLTAGGNTDQGAVKSARAILFTALRGRAVYTTPMAERPPGSCDQTAREIEAEVKRILEIIEERVVPRARRDGEKLLRRISQELDHSAGRLHESQAGEEKR
jgi:hypothetical protein